MNTLLQIHKNIYIRGTFPRRMRHITCYTRHRNKNLYFLTKLFEQYHLSDDLFEYFLELLEIKYIFEPLQIPGEPCWNCDSDFFLICDSCCQETSYDYIGCNKCKSKYFCKLCCNCCKTKRCYALT